MAILRMLVMVDGAENAFQRVEFRTVNSMTDDELTLFRGAAVTLRDIILRQMAPEDEE